MQAFEYRAVRTTKEAVSLLAQHGDKACILSGGTDVLVQLREGRKRAEHVIDVKGIPGLNELSFDSEKGLTLGAAVPCHRIYDDETVARVYPGLVDAASLIGGIQIQSRATFGGNVCNASPAADSIPALIAHQATCEIAGPNGDREVPIEDLCTGPGRTVLANGEILVAFHLPSPAPFSAGAYQRFIPRNEMDIAVAGVGAFVQLCGELDHFKSIRVGLGAVAPTPLLVELPEDIRGKLVSTDVIESIASAAQEAVNPITDMRGSITQRRHLVGVLTRRVLQQCIERVEKSRET